MSALQDKTGVWFVYDGDCPICSHAAEALCIKQEFGELFLLNAREQSGDPLFDEINKRGLDLDEGMVIYARGEFYHGKGAVQFMAKHGRATNAFTLACKSLFWSGTVSTLFYPWMRGVRNWLLRRKRIGRIDNLGLKNNPTFKSIFGENWAALPPVMKKHYANHPYSNEVNTVEGRLDVFCKPPLLWLAPLMRASGQIPVFNASDVPVAVHFESEVNSKAFHFNRRFDFNGRKPYVFHSRMIPTKDNEVVEVMRFGLGWRAAFVWDGERVRLMHKGYALHLFGHFIPIPLAFLMGEGNASEYPVDESTFNMEVDITHPWWGKIYGYSGQFKVCE